jgi:hypothetical protein
MLLHVLVLRLKFHVLHVLVLLKLHMLHAA